MKNKIVDPNSLRLRFVVVLMVHSIKIGLLYTKEHLLWLVVGMLLLQGLELSLRRGAASEIVTPICCCAKTLPIHTQMGSCLDRL